MIELFVGPIGCGKTCFANKLISERAKRYRNVVANFPTTLAPYFDFELLETHFPPVNSLVVLDEVGICANSRAYKSFGQGKIEYFKLSGHNGDAEQGIFRGDDILCFSQSYEDMDITIKRLVTRLWFLRRVGAFCIAKRVYKDPSDIDQNHQIVDGYSKRPFLLEMLVSLFKPKSEKTIRFCYLPKWYKCHTRYAMPPRPRIEITHTKNA